MTYTSRPNIDQLSRDLIEDLGLSVTVSAEVVDGEEHLARFPISTKRGTAQLGRAS